MKSLKLSLLTFLIIPFTACTTPTPDNSKSENNTTEIIAEQPIETPKKSEPKTNAIVVENVSYLAGQDGVIGYMAKPNLKGKLPAVILIHEWWGLNDNIKQTAEKFAKQGYVALAVDLYNGRSAETPDEARELATEVRGDMDGAFANLTAAVEYLKTQPEVSTQRMASIGWCFGGGWSYEMAKNDLGVRASVIYYGHFNPEDDLEQMKATLQGHFGEDDMSIAIDGVREFQAKLQTLNGDHEVYIYPNSDHAFANEESDRYNQEAAELAWERTLKFLEEQL